MPKLEARRERFEKEARRYREQAEGQVALSVWDCDAIKQFVRRYGWLQVIDSYKRRMRREGVTRPLKYLTIPGPNASDIGLLWRNHLLARTATGFPDVTICDDTNAERIVANLGELRGYSSHSFHEAVRWPTGELCPFFPFDVINLDFCGAIITGTPNRNKALRQLAGIRWIFRLQRGQGFLLLLTASTDNESARSTLERVLVNNLDNEDKFRDVYQQRYRVMNPEPFQGDYRALVQIIVPKVIARMARDLGYKMQEHFAAKYDRPSHRMICHSFEFEFLGRKKAEKKYNPYFKEISLDEVSEELPSKAKKQSLDAYVNFIPSLLQRSPQDIGSELSSDTALKHTLEEEAKLLIEWWKI